MKRAGFDNHYGLTRRTWIAGSMPWSSSSWTGCSETRAISKALGGGDGIGCTKAGKGVKIMDLVDARGLPVEVETAIASPYETRLVQRLFDFMLTVETPQRVLAEKAHDATLPHYPSHAPSWSTVTPAAAAKQSLSYVSPSQPQTGANSSVQATGRSVQTP